MTSTIVKNELAVGAFVAFAAVISLMFLMKRTRDKGLLDTHQVTLTVPHGSGLQTGAPVLMRGIQVGQIGYIKLTDDRQVQVTCDIAPRFARFVTSDAKATIVEPPLLGATTVEIDPGTGEAAKEDSELQAKIRGSFLARLDSLEGRVRGVVARVDSTLTTVHSIGRSLESGKGLAGRLLNDPALADDAAGAIKDLRAIARSLSQGKGALARAINDDQLGADVSATVSDARAVAGELRNGKGSLGRLLKDPKLVEESIGLVKDVRRSLAKLDALNDQATRTAGKVNQVLDSTHTVTKELASTLKRVNTGKGTIASLLNDPGLYRETKSLLKELRESVEDLREQAPINSFIGVVFAAF